MQACPVAVLDAMVDMQTIISPCCRFGLQLLSLTVLPMPCSQSQTSQYASLSRYVTSGMPWLCLLLEHSVSPPTTVQLWKYSIGSAIGILPGVCLYVMIGRLASSIAEVSSGEMRETSNPTLVFTTVGISIVVLLILVVLLTRYAKKALADQLEEDTVAVEESAAEAQPAELDNASAEDVPADTSVQFK